MLFVKVSSEITAYFGSMSPHKIEKSLTKDDRQRRSLTYVLDIEEFSRNTKVIAESLDVGSSVGEQLLIE
tara:strand:- start:720 stop:929 length:210 start_codon:yes stop_codon:yes gene_type:complete